MRPARNDIPVEYLRECFDVNALGELFWKQRPSAHFTEKTRPWCLAGCRAGRINNRGYWMVTLYHAGGQRKLLVHRIVWTLAHGEWPKNFIDHINRVRTDNRVQNLRDVTHTENMQNAKRVRKYGLPNSPAAGVYPTPNGKFRAQIKRNGKCRHLGTFQSVDGASAAFAAASLSEPL